MTRARQSETSTWISEIEDLLTMTLAARRGLEEAMGGRIEKADEEACAVEAEGCRRAIRVLQGLRPGEMSVAGLRGAATTALRSAGLCPTVLEWSCAVVAGDARRFWSAYHPRRALAGVGPGDVAPAPRPASMQRTWSLVRMKWGDGTTVLFPGKQQG